jgi:hypothetical protein
MPYNITTSLMQGWKHNFNAIDTDHRPSWKNHGTGFAELDITSHKDRPYLSFHITENSRGNSALYPDGGRGSRREVFVQFDENEGRKLYEWLKTLYEKGY